MTNWKEYKVEEFAEVIGGGTPSTKNPDYFGGSIPWITPKDLTNYEKKFIKNGDRNITKEGLSNSSAKLIPKNSILLTSRAPIGYLAIAENDVTTNQGFKSIVVNPDIADFNFVYYLIKANVERIKGFGTGTTFAEVSATVVKNLKFKLPDLPTQTAIAEILSSLDDKIELNNLINQELENLAQTLFKQWFIDFEFPNTYGEPYKSSGGEMVESELGEIPKGWEVGTFGDLCKVVNGYAFKSKDFQETGNNGILKIRNVNGSIVDIINTQFVANTVVQSIQEKFRVLSGHILIAMTGAEVGKIGIVPETNKSLWLNQRVGRFEPIIENSMVFIYHLFNVLNFTQAVRNSAMGSAQPNISASGIESLHCIIPPKEIILRYSLINQDSFNLSLKNLGENQELTNLRDNLLPKLISGEIEVAQAEAAIA